MKIFLMEQKMIENVNDTRSEAEFASVEHTKNCIK